MPNKKPRRNNKNRQAKFQAHPRIAEENKKRRIAKALKKAELSKARTLRKQSRPQPSSEGSSSS